MPCKRSIQVEAAREAILESVGGFGDATDQSAGVELGGRLDGEVLDDDEVFFASEDFDREMPLDASRVEFEQDPGVAVIGRAADRDEREDRTSLGIGPRVAQVDGLVPIELQ